MNIQQFKKKYLNKVNPIDLELLLEFMLQKSKEFLLIHPTYKMSLWQWIKLDYYTRQLQQCKPLNYITGEKEFYGLKFKVNEHTLIPRPETEQIVDIAKNILLTYSKGNFTVIDLGTGSGNIIISLAKNFRSAYFYASDISKQALEIAKINALFHQVRVKFVQGSLLEPFRQLLTNNASRPIISGCCSNISVSYDRSADKITNNKNLLIVANLPYLSNKIYNDIATGIKKYEPKTALVSGTEGLNHYYKLFQQVRKIKSNEGFSFKQIFLLLEISPEQKEKIDKKIKKVLPDAKIIYHRDLAQKWRITVIKM